MLAMTFLTLLSKDNDPLRSQCHASYKLPVTQCKSRKSVCGGGDSYGRCNGESIVVTVLVFRF